MTFAGGVRAKNSTVRQIPTKETTLFVFSHGGLFYEFIQDYDDLLPSLLC